MQESIINQIEIYIRASIADHNKASVAHQSVNIFDKFIERCQLYYEGPAHNLAEIKAKMNKKLKGDIFEHFCLKYCQTCLGFSEVWLLADLPTDIRDSLNLRKQDFGIDLIAKDYQGRYHAIQAKYRKHTNRKQYSALSWKQLSTFHALASRTGPYYKHIVITNANYCRQMGKKTIKDKSICYASLRGIKLEDWLAMGQLKGRRLDEIPKLSLGLTFKKEKIAEKKIEAVDKMDEFRKARLAFLDRLENKTKESD